MSSLIYCLMVTGPAYGNQRSSSALQFAESLLICGHKISAVFFYQEGVYNANRLSSPAIDEIDLVRSWCNLALPNKISMHVCIAAALRRGVIDSLQSSLLNIKNENCQYGFTLSGLGYLAEIALECNRFIQF